MNTTGLNTEKIISNPSISIFTDFDGTIMKKEPGDEVFREFGDYEHYFPRLINREIGIAEYWNLLCASLKPGTTEEIISRFALTFEMDSNFFMFANFCRDKGLELSVISDGFGAYIRPILKNVGLDWINVFCNELIFKDASSPPHPVFPFADEACHCFCASCKRNEILANTPDDNIIVFIGDGISDLCAAEHSDIIFAKASLAAYCNEKRIPHYPWSNFFDVYRILADILAKGKYKHRHQAKLLRKKAFENE